MPGPLRALLAIAGGLLAGQALHALGVPLLAGGDELWEDWVSSVVPILAAVLLTAGAVRADQRRPAWIVLTVGLWCWAIATVLWTFAFDRGQEWIALVLFLPLYPCGMAYLVLDLRLRCERLPAAVWLVLVAAVLAVAALGFGLVLPMAPDTSPAALAFPILDVTVIAMVAAIFTIARWSPGPDWLCWGLAFGAFVAGDLSWVIGGTAGVVSLLLWSLAPVLLACVPWMRVRALPAASVVVPSRLPWPYALWLASLGLVMAGTYTRIPPAALWLAVASILVSASRTAQTYRAVRALPETRRLARTDELTGLTNRRGFLQTLEDQLHRHPARPVAVLMLDLDRFKDLNDTLGHATGDALLSQLGPRLAAALRPADTLARLGGDEFAVLCPGAGGTGARAVARRLQDALQAPFALGGLELHDDASIGIATYPADGGTVEELLQRADVAMYQAKGDGTDVERYDPARDEHSRDRLKLVVELRAAF